MAGRLPGLRRAGGSVVSLPIESLRMGGMPAPLPDEPAGIPYFEWPDDDEEGWRPDDPVMAKLGEGVYLHRYADVRACGQCGADFVSARYLDAHKRQHDPRANG